MSTKTLNVPFVSRIVKRFVEYASVDRNGEKRLYSNANIGYKQAVSVPIERTFHSTERGFNPND